MTLCLQVVSNVQVRNRGVGLTLFLGGAVACVAAGRLAKANPDLSILLIEQGRNNLDDVSVRTPALCWSHVAPGSKTILLNRATKESSLAGREVIVQTGGILGGGSSVNALMYTRGEQCCLEPLKLSLFFHTNRPPSFGCGL